MYNRYWVLQWVRRENLCERDTATPRWPVRGRESERQADIYGRGAREALRLRLLATALAVFTMMCSHTRSSPSIWEFLPFSPHVAPSHVVSLVPGTKNIYRRLFRGWERRGGTRGWEQERSVISRLSGIAGFLESCRSSPFPISNVSSISRAVSPWFLRFQDIGRISSSSFTRKIAKANSWIVEKINVYLFFLVDYYLRKFWEWEI